MTEFDAWRFESLLYDLPTFFVPWPKEWLPRVPRKVRVSWKAKAMLELSRFVFAPPGAGKSEYRQRFFYIGDGIVGGPIAFHGKML